ncbi:hypothetical protein PIB30_005617 [Stylosanthes scabra]|uniref:Ubiquitin-like protease family profile domain-containing protein n=1 Tax=Stylosanthes scabra TaxID=79078 RepID=A0ABU6S4G9_9FABA|nr:hypothetical protein [Stylosanthes scabra]
MCDVGVEEGCVTKQEGSLHGKADSKSVGRDGVGNNGLRSCKTDCVETASGISAKIGICHLFIGGHEYPLLYQAAIFGSPFAFWSHNRTEMLAEETPNCLELAFRPSAGMRFVGTELAVAAYIFANAGEENERIYQDANCDGSRFRLWSLIPGEELYDDVLNMVVGMCSGSKRDGSAWWLPTTFSIYIPMHIGRHWYLMLINIWGREIVYLDSQRSDDERETSARVAQMMEVARFVEEMLREKSFWSKKDAYPPYVTDYEPLAPDVGYQAPGSMDYGVWEINASTRMALAVDLVTSPQNPLADVIWERAVNFWDAEMLRNHRIEEAANLKSRSPPPSGSSTI